ncbi:VanZ family protein [Texcoconibacillus texcoconensis]|uniref:Glycopeptide antibiotics resistance protein n=1 Tax=Texcoconibacillus texcoconensis TaxID=1095777 RepID=A0A840QSA4_9BACI|nr:VanZ family protein [Texcoconibacillus texcoconensis]MBB5174198.1 glycopeptide antibiotics resistance protein [Texcoconibacillus texcoconensis]
MVLTPSFIPIWIVFFFVGAALCLYLRKIKSESIVYIMFFCIYYIYILFVLAYTQFPIYLTTPPELAMSAEELLSYNVNLTPDILSILSEPGILNVVMTVPFGFGLCFLKQVSLKKIILWGFSFSFILESLQLINMMITRYSFRSFDINDLLFNTLGAVIGYLLFILFAKSFLKIVKRWDIGLGNINEYIYNVSYNHH